MKKDAEAHARDDEEKRLVVEAKNRLDSTIFTGEKTLKDFADKIKSEDKEKIEGKLKDAKDLLNKTEVKKDEFDKMSEELSQILQTVGAAVYQQQGQPGAENSQPSAEESTKTDDSKKEAEEGEIVK